MVFTCKETACLNMADLVGIEAVNIGLNKIRETGDANNAASTPDR
jgi:hypothetical protein